MESKDKANGKGYVKRKPGGTHEDIVRVLKLALSRGMSYGKYLEAVSKGQIKE